MGFMILENVKKIIFLILIFIVGEQMKASEKDNDVPYIRYAKEIMNPFIQHCEKDYNLDCIGTGGRFAKNVGGIEINFIAYRKGTIEEARTLEVNMIETLLAKVNDCEKIKPFLREYPFKSKDIDISVAFRENDNSRYIDGSVALTFLAKGNLFYCAENPKTGELVDILKEPYEEAIKIVNKSK
jgi:hypothetical protein